MKRKLGGGHVYVSGSLSAPQRPSTSVTGLSFEGEAYRATDPEELQMATDLFALYRVFFSDELNLYLKPPAESDYQPHGLYVARVTEWTIFDGRLPYEQRVTRIPWPPASDSA